MLAILTAFAQGFAAIASSPIGPPLMAAVSAMSALRLATAGLDALTTKTASGLARIGVDSAGATKGLAGVQKAAVGLAALQVAVVALRQLQDAFAETLPGMEEMKSRLYDLYAGESVRSARSSIR